MTNEEIINYIYKKRNNITSEESFESTKEVLEKLGNPQDDLKFIHIAGTNGKGSTTTMIANVLKNSGYKVGKFISPYIISFNERIQINDNYITNDEIEEYIKQIDPIISNMDNAPAGFALITIIAFLHFKKNNCDFVCLETGLGGRIDPTNVIKNTLVSVITLIDFDHTKLLGNTIKEIASEKCGIIKDSKVTVSYPVQEKDALDTIRKYCKERNNKLYIPNLKYLDIVKSNHSINYFSYKGTYYKLNLIGQYQIYNALTAITTINVLISLGYKISFSAITTGVSNANFPARLEKSKKVKHLYIDGSHNVAGAKSLKDFLYEYKGKRNYAIIAFTKDKDYKAFLDEISSYFTEIVFTQYENEYKKSEEIDNLLAYAKEKNINAIGLKDNKEALDYVVKKDNADLILITGSLYLASNYIDLLGE